MADNALLLEVESGPDGLAPRLVNVKTAAYTSARTADAPGLKIAVVKEGFGHANSEKDVDALVRKGSEDEVSVPRNLAGPPSGRRRRVLEGPLRHQALFGQYALNKYRGHYYAKSQNLARTLRAAYDIVLKDYDLLLMPPLRLKATPLPAAGAPRIEVIQRAFEMITKTTPFDVTGPARDERAVRPERGLPAGMMLSIYRAASAWQKAGNSRG